jgi:hypothetical protein
MRYVGAEIRAIKLDEGEGIGMERARKSSLYLSSSSSTAVALVVGWRVPSFSRIAHLSKNWEGAMTELGCCLSCTCSFEPGILPRCVLHMVSPAQCLCSYLTHACISMEK